ncbi:MAG TPA: hypothetical protein QGF58_29295 [Myxococcota bacterium]|nr:hypothetical protein [Myxococcota bacterium]
MFESLKSAPEALRERQRALVNQLRHRAHVVRGAGRERIFEVEADALVRLGDLLDAADVLPLSEKWVDSAEKVVEDALANLTTPDIEGYDALNAKSAAKAVRGVDDWVDLVRVRRYETEHKNRKTVLGVVDSKLAALKEAPQAA